MRINDHIMELVDDWEPFYDPIYSLGLVELEIQKMYIEDNLDNGFIRSSKSLIGASIFFDKKPNKILQFYVDY